MKKLISIMLIACFVCSGALCTFAEESDDPFDLSDEQQKISELGIPTVSSVAQLKAEADALWEKKDYQNAAPAYAYYAKQANWLANLITAGLEPYYSASSSKKKDWDPPYQFIGTLASAESMSNEYKKERNRAMLYEGMCYYYMNNYEIALPKLIKALDVIEVTEITYWKLGMEALFSIVGYNGK